MKEILSRAKQNIAELSSCTNKLNIINKLKMSSEISSASKKLSNQIKGNAKQ